MRFYVVPFLKPVYMSEETFEQWRATEGGEREVEGFFVTEMGRWSKPAVPAPVSAPELVVEDV